MRRGLTCAEPGSHPRGWALKLPPRTSSWFCTCCSPFTLGQGTFQICRVRNKMGHSSFYLLLPSKRKSFFSMGTRSFEKRFIKRKKKKKGRTHTYTQTRATEENRNMTSVILCLCKILTLGTNQGGGCLGFLCIAAYNCMQSYNYVKIKSLIEEIIWY